LDPAVVSLDDEDSLLVSRFVYEGLVGLDMDGNLVPALAISWVVSGDELDYVFTLRADVLFHDGTQLNADLIKDNFDRWFDTENSLHGDSSYEGWDTYMLGFKGDTIDDGSPLPVFDTVEKVDDLTILIHLNRPVPEFLENLAHPAFSILNPAALAADGDDYGTASGSSIGTGPYSVFILMHWLNAILRWNKLIPKISYLLA
jgi:peptide/nickel transport system substrate-binding protein